MRSLSWVPLFLIALCAMVMIAAAQAPGGQGAAARGPAPPAFAMTVAGFADGGDFPVKNSAAGEMVTPAVSWVNPPAGTVSFVLNLHDMDTPARNKTQVDTAHWLVWNIPGDATGLPEAIPKGNPIPGGGLQTSADGPGTYRPPGFAGNGPKHHYTFELYALDTKLDIQPGSDAYATRAEILKAVEGHTLAKGVYMGLFHRPR